MKMTFSKKQWEFIGKKAGWIKEAQMPNGQSQLGQQLAVSINAHLARMNMPNIQSQARSLAAQLVALVDKDAALAQQADAQPTQNPPQA